MLENIDGLEEGQLTDDDRIEDVLMAIEHAAVEYENISRLVMSIEAAKNSGNLVTQQQSLQIAQLSLRNTHRSFYGGDEGFTRQALSVESMANSTWVVMALEEEANDGKNILERIIDAITGAFKWLWEKISSVFSSGDTEKSADEKGAATMSALEKQMKSTPNFPSGSVLKGGKVGRFLQHLGEDITISAIGDTCDKQAKQADELVKLIVAISERLRAVSSVADHIKSTPTTEVLKKEKDEFEAGVKKAVTDNVTTVYAEGEHGKYHAVKEPAAIVPADSRVIGPVATEAGPAVTVIAALTAGGYKGMIGAGARGEKKDAKITLPSALSELIPFQEKVNKFLVAVGRMNDDLKSKSGSLKADGKKAADALSGLKGSVGKGEDAFKVIKEYCDIARNIGGLQGSMTTTVQNFQKSSLFLNTIVDSALDLVRTESEKGKKEKPDDAKTDDAKPAENKPDETKPEENKA